MDLTEEKVSFDQMPTVVSELKQEISGLKTLVRTLIDAAGAATKDAWMNIDELRAYHTDHPARPTIYEWVGKKAFRGCKSLRRVSCVCRIQSYIRYGQPISVSRKFTIFAS